MIKGNLFRIVAGVCLLGAAVLFAQEQRRPQEQPKLQEEVTVRWWLVPVYAVDKAGSPVLNLTPEDLEVYIRGIRVEPFSLIKKRFQVTQAKAGAAPAPAVEGPVQKKMVFLVFDAAFSPYNLLSRARSIAETVIGQSDKSAQYVLLTIEPFAGLRYVLGPTADFKQLSKSMKKYVEGKEADYLLERGAKRAINNPYPDGDPRNYGSELRPTSGGQRKQFSLDPLARMKDKIDWTEKRRVAASYASSLITLDLVLGQFKDYSKVVYLYSCGIPGQALLDRTEMDGGPGQSTVNYSFDSIAYDTLKTVGGQLNKSGALFFIVNPAGTRMAESDQDSGESSLRILANESGGRYFEGAEKDISRQVNSMEGGYYEISFPDKPEYGGQEMGFEIRSKKPDVQILTVKTVGRDKTLADLTEVEQDALVLNILNKGPYADTMQRVSYVEGQAFKEGDTLVCRIPLPAALALSEWSVFKVRRNPTTGEIQIERGQIIPETPTCEVRMAWKGKEFRHDIVLTQAKTGTILVWK